MDDNDPDHATTHEFLHQHLSQQQAIHSQYPSVPPHHTSQRSKRPYSPSLDFAGFTQPSDNESDDEAFNQLTQTDPDNVADDAELSATTLRKMLRRMQKLEGAIKKLKQEKQPQGGTTSLDQIQGQSGNHAEMSSQQAHQQQQEHQRQQRRQQEEHFASLEMLQAAQMAMPLTVHPDHLSDSQTLASASNYAFDPAHIDPTLLPVSVSDGSPNAVASSSKLPPRKKRKKNKGKDGDEIGVEDDRLDADDEAGGASPLTKVRAPKPKKVHTPELNRAVLRRMYQLLNIRSPKDSLPHPHDPDPSQPAEQDTLHSSFHPTDGIQAPQDGSATAVDVSQALATSHHLNDSSSGIQIPSLAVANLDEISHMAFADQDGSHGLDLGAVQSDENAAAVVMQLVMAAQSQGNAAAAAAAAREQASTDGRHPHDDGMVHGSNHLVHDSPGTSDYMRKPPTFLDEPLDEEIAEWKGYVPNWIKKADEKNQEWIAAVAASVIRSPPVTELKAKPIPSEHLDPKLALISAKTSFTNLCEKYKRQTDDVAKEKGARHKRLTRRKGRRAEKLMRRQKARQSDDFLATEWHRNHSNLDVDAALNIDYMSSEHSDDDDDPADFQQQATIQLPGVDLGSKIVLELRSPQWQSQVLFDLWNSLDTLYPVVLRKISPEHFFAPAHPRFRRNPLRDLPPRAMPSADWMIDPVWQATNAGVLEDVLGQVEGDEGMEGGGGGGVEEGSPQPQWTI